MAAKLQVRLSFEGGEEMKRALKELGIEGQKGFGKIGTAAGGIKTALGAVGDAVSAVVKGLTILGGATLAAGGAIVALAKSSADAADQAGKEAQKVGITADAYQRLAFAAKESDVETDALRTSLVQLNKAIANGDPKKVAIFQKLGIGLTEAGGKLRSADKVLLDLSERFSKIPDGAEKTAIAVALLGKSGADLIPLLNQGAVNILLLGKEAERLGLIFSEKAIAQSDKFGDTLDRLLAAITGVKNAVGQLLIPELTRLASSLTNFIVENRAAILEWVQKGWLFLVQIVKDLVALFQGRESDVVNDWILTARDALKQTLDAALAVSSAVIGITEAFRALGSAIAAPFRAIGAAGEALQAMGPKNKINIPGFASGGHIRGPGTGTSDSILARLSNGEFVMRRSAVDALGLPLLNALNAGMMPAFAEGGAVGGGRPVNLNIGGESFAMSAEGGIVGQLMRYSRGKALRSPGRKPSWAGRK
jgi:hypothetical protein